VFGLPLAGWRFRIVQRKVYSMKRQIEIERKIVARVKREMNKPRLTKSVRKGFTAQAAAASDMPTAKSERERVHARL
jgi:hypothetical protein